MNMELTRSQYKQLLGVLDNDIEKADAISDLIEGWTPVVQAPIVYPNAPQYPAGAREIEGVARTFSGKDVRTIGGVTE